MYRVSYVQIVICTECNVVAISGFLFFVQFSRVHVRGYTYVLFACHAYACNLRVHVKYVVKCVRFACTRKICG